MIIKSFFVKRKSMGVRKEYEALAPAYTLIRQLLLARQHLGLTSGGDCPGKSVLQRARFPCLESGGKHIPSITTLRKYAEAIGCELEIKLVPKKQD